MHDFGAKIVSLDEFALIRPTLEGKIVATSGPFDPIHPGHTSCIMESKKFGDTLVVIVNGNWFCTNKKGKPFQDLETRALIVSAIRSVDYVIPFEIEGDMTVSQALEAVRPHIFTKGGDRKNLGTKYDNIGTIPEWPVCQKHNIKIVTGVGMDKQWSSSWFLKDWEEHIKQKRRKPPYNV